MSTQRNRSPRIYGSSPAGLLLLGVTRLFQILGGTGVAAVGVYALSR
ncbi:hypothetical protein OG226_02395 [Streptomyces sp. NBC_01261]|nr:hypothetical protein [Streptomyces sp. NBC_01261]